MKRDVQLRALQAAARVAFSVGSIAVFGCGGATSEPESPTPSGTATATDPGKTTTTDPNAPSGNNTTPNREAEPTNPPSTPTTPTTPSTPAKSCEKVVSDAFPTPGMYPGTKQNVSAEVTSCCEKLLLESQGDFENRWDCCANVDQKKDQKVMIACTPWGPPVPPRMIARKRLIDRLVA